MDKAVKGTLPHTYAVYDEDKERKKAEKKEIQYKDESTHRVLTLEEYNSMLEEKKNLELQIWRLNNKVKEDAETAERQLKREKKTYESKIEELQNKLERAEALTNNALRIIKDKANADRKISPRKAGTGFIIRSIKENWIDAGHNYKDRCYITTIETPYPVSMSIDLLDPDALKKDCFANIFDLFVPDNRGESIEDKAYTDYFYPYGEDHKEKGSYAKHNVVFRRNWQTGNRGYWEIVCWHTKPFPTVDFGKIFKPVKPDEMEYGGEWHGEKYYYDPSDPEGKPFRIEEGKKVFWDKNENQN